MVTKALHQIHAGLADLRRAHHAQHAVAVVQVHGHMLHRQRPTQGRMRAFSLLCVTDVAEEDV